MKVTIFGSGYVGLVTGTCLAEVGNDVLCVDIDVAKIEGLKQGLEVSEVALKYAILRTASNAPGSIICLQVSGFKSFREINVAQ